MSIILVFFVLAAVFFFCEGFRVPATVSWTGLAWGCLTIGFTLLTVV